MGKRTELWPIRQWAKKNGFEVSDHGKISDRIIRAYNRDQERREKKRVAAKRRRAQIRRQKMLDSYEPQYIELPVLKQAHQAGKRVLSAWERWVETDAFTGTLAAVTFSIGLILGLFL